MTEGPTILGDITIRLDAAGIGVSTHMVSRIEPDRYADTGFAVKDTPPEINRRLFDAMMRKTPAERLMMSLDMMATARELVMQGIHREAGTVTTAEAK